MALPILQNEWKKKFLDILSLHRQISRTSIFHHNSEDVVYHFSRQILKGFFFFLFIYFVLFVGAAVRNSGFTKFLNKTE